MTNKLINLKKTIFRSFGEFFSNPAISALCQINPISVGISTYLSGSYSQEQYETLTDFLHLLNSRVKSIEDKYITKDFLDSREGKRIIAKIFRSILRDNRKEKLIAMSNLTVNLYIKSKLTIDEKELYIDILDVLNSLQLSILQNAVLIMRNRTDDKHRGLGWELIAKKYEQKGISKALILQSIRVLESNGLINQNNAIVGEADKTHFITDFGEQFYSYISYVNLEEECGN